MMQLLTALLLGLVYTVPPGPVNVETIRRGATTGFRGALGLQFGALVGDLVYAVLALLGAGTLLPASVLHLGLAPVSALVLVYLGYTALRDGISGLRRAETHAIVRGGDGATALRHGALAGFGIAMVNPFAVAFWLTVGSAMLPHDRGSDIPFLAAFFLGMLAWAVVLPWACQALLRGPAIQVISLVCGVVLVGFAVAVGSSVAFPAGGIGL